MFTSQSAELVPKLGKESWIGDAPGRSPLSLPSSPLPCARSRALCLSPDCDMSHCTRHGLAESFHYLALLQFSLRPFPPLAWMSLQLLSLSHQPPFYSQDMSQMYENILYQPLRIPGGQTVAACDLLQGLLHKDQRQRLGSKSDFVSELPVEHWSLTGGSATCRSSLEAQWRASGCPLKPGLANSFIWKFTAATA